MYCCSLSVGLECRGFFLDGRVDGRATKDLSQVLNVICDIPVGILLFVLDGWYSDSGRRLIHSRRHGRGRGTPASRARLLTGLAICLGIIHAKTRVRWRPALVRWRPASVTDGKLARGRAPLRRGGQILRRRVLCISIRRWQCKLLSYPRRVGLVLCRSAGQQNLYNGISGHIPAPRGGRIGRYVHVIVVS